MKPRKKLTSSFATRKQSAVADAEYKKHQMEMPSTLKFGRITRVNQTNDTAHNKVGAYITYDVILSPNGVTIQDVPSCVNNSSQVIDRITPSAPALTTINYEETPFILGQPVLVGFVNGSNLNPVILMACPSQFAPSQTSTQYPQKTESWQGTTRVIDKSGNVTYNIVSNQKFKIQINGTTLATVDGTNNTVDIGTGVEFGVLGNTLQTFLNSVFNAVSGHTHSGVTTGVGVTGPPVAITVPTVTTTVLKVQ